MAIHTNTSAVYLCTNQELQVEAREEGFDFIFGTDVANNELSFYSSQNSSLTKNIQGQTLKELISY